MRFFVFLLLAACGNAFHLGGGAAERCNTNRRDLIEGFAGMVGANLLLSSAVAPPAFASGGATAGKYTTIPIAKRRYYGRVQAAVHDFLLIGPVVVKGDMSAPEIKNFFDPEGLVVVEARRQDVNGQCTKKNKDCKGSEVRDSIYNDMKTSMYLLANAFRINQTKAPDNLPTVKAAKAFFKEMDAMEKRVKKGKAGDKEAIGHYAAALDILDEYLDLVELPPTGSGLYDQEFSRAVGESARLT
mmetsp:Transcript_74162/g.214837  ORF Transcript_74162/g.214837 Transcript_74162/m.214837 type:complete len:243 (+) Transcript_74162:158-886(+)|eukprot:CAMPEP_0176019130 /NCGR_PEP_ID=MMETSP0120_2-20121206/9232_1 /TAXON_ID=160619 /ORGANISM="Kryptoperidinium foliaceum, Strain CCMP 1326" /LENGTH=242 /DNA_ID=CAMNT_0017352197 /DNA_START=103 /DNA_END=831 /DNA_ORIENTATION=+